MRKAILACLAMLLAAPQLRAADAEPGSVLIHNVHLPERDGDADVVVSLLIKGGELHLVSRDKIKKEEAELALDAENGFLLGKLAAGKSPSFLILDGDPREDPAILLDTKTHARFAVVEGEIVRNRLKLLSEVETEEEKKTPGWLAYAPPPIALSPDSLDRKRWNAWEGKWVSGIFTSALILDRQRWFGQDDASKEQVGDLSDFDGGEIRAFRFGLLGTLNFERPWVYTIFGATNAFDKGFDTDEVDNIALLDWRLDIPIVGATTLSVGKQKEPMSLERVTSMIFLPMQERSAAADALMPSRNVGVVLNGTAFGQRISWGAGAFNDWFDTGKKFDDSATQYVVRLTGRPYVSPDGASLAHVGFGFRHSDAKEGLQFRTEPEFNSAPDFVDTGAFEADSAKTYNFEAALYRAPFWLLGEYTRADVSAPSLGDPRFEGYQITASWAITGEARSYRKKSGTFSHLPVARSVYQGGWGAVELAARWSELDLDDGSIEGGKLKILSLGANWWLTSIFHVGFNYRDITLDRFGVRGKSKGLNIRLLLILE